MISHLKAERTVKPVAEKKAPGARIKVLAEAVLLQSLEDLWIDEERHKCIDFFSGEEFHICSKIAGLGSNDKLKMLLMVEDIVDLNSGKNRKVRGVRGIRANRRVRVINLRDQITNSLEV